MINIDTSNNIERGPRLNETSAATAVGVVLLSPLMIPTPFDFGELKKLDKKAKAEKDAQMRTGWVKPHYKVRGSQHRR